MSATGPSRVPYAVAALLTAGVVAFAWSARDRLHGVVPGSEAPVFEAVTLDGEPRTLDDFRGKVVLLNVWATWCPPCRYEMPSMQRLYETFDGQDFEIVAVSIDAPVGRRDAVGNLGGDIRAFADSLSLTFPILHDPQGRIQRTYQTAGVPESFVIGRDGRIYRRVSGAIEWDTPAALDFIQRLLDQEA